jgi:hypothetical protein
MGSLTREILIGCLAVFSQETVGFQEESGMQPVKRSAPLRGGVSDVDGLENCSRPGVYPLFDQFPAPQPPIPHQTAHFYRY